MREEDYRIHGQVGDAPTTMVVTWCDDAGGLGNNVAQQLVTQLGCAEVGEIEVVNFFALGGVSVEHDVAEFPEGKFYASPQRQIVVVKSDPPVSEWYGFLNVILDVAEHHCSVKELYTIGGMVSMSAHTTPRQLLAMAGSTEFKEVLSQYGITRDIDYETPDGHRPTLNSFLLWLAKQRGIPAAGLWVPVPFYMVTSEDPKAWRKVLEFLDSRLGLGLDFSDIDDRARSQGMRIAQALARAPDLQESVQRLETNLMISQEDSERLVAEMEKLFRQRG